jgi:peptidoglycan-N-acetylglucosamine deacetylase
MVRYIILSIFLFSICQQSSLAQKRVAITIDDIPNTTQYEKYGVVSPVLEVTDSMNIPVAIFINEGLLYTTSNFEQNRELLENWIKRDYTAIGNHTFSHLRYSETDFVEFTRDVLKGEEITRVLASAHGKNLAYFRFPYNDLGHGKVQYEAISRYLSAQNYKIVPFTIESSDWMFNSLYEHYHKMEKQDEAERIGNAYIEYTLSLFDYFEQLSHEIFKRSIHHIYLGHDNKLNADYLPILTDKLSDRDYSFISLEEALRDPVYESEEHYHGKWGYSWIYRWVEDHHKRFEMIKNEPDVMQYYREFERISSSK